MKKIALFSLLLIFSFSGLHAQAGTYPELSTALHFDMTDFPQWSRDLRRASIVTFGAFPFMYLFANFGYDTYRLATNDWDMRFAPRPFTAAGGIEQNHAERVRVIAIAAAGSVLISLIDFNIERTRRNRRAREAQALAPPAPIIIRTPLLTEYYEGIIPEAEMEAEANNF
ncbi:MAG: hypothetical protein LBG93_00035 [Treponema sp.]|jgi:hypothetical protein|nr:hypothetical protein [Treponema sp.]